MHCLDLIWFAFCLVFGQVKGSEKEKVEKRYGKGGKWLGWCCMPCVKLQLAGQISVTWVGVVLLYYMKSRATPPTPAHSLKFVTHFGALYVRTQKKAESAFGFLYCVKLSKREKALGFPLFFLHYHSLRFFCFFLLENSKSFLLQNYHFVHITLPVSDILASYVENGIVISHSSLAVIPKIIKPF